MGTIEDPDTGEVLDLDSLTRDELADIYRRGLSKVARRRTAAIKGQATKAANRRGAFESAIARERAKRERE